MKKLFIISLYFLVAALMAGSGVLAVAISVRPDVSWIIGLLGMVMLGASIHLNMKAISLLIQL